MTNKYKLIKNYPHPNYSLILEMIIEETPYKNYICTSIPNSSMTFNKSEIIDFPIYWELIIEEEDLSAVMYSVDDMEEAFDRGVTTGLADFSNKYTGVNFLDWIKSYTKEKLEGE